MRKGLFCLCLSIWLVLSSTSTVSAADFKLHVTVNHQQDGTTCGELWYNEFVLWRVALLADGAKPVAGSNDPGTLFLAPDFQNGFFTLHVYRQP